MYKLFIGFRKLGEFDGLLTAKQYAQNSGLTGTFNLIGDDGYRDSWYATGNLLTIKDSTGARIEVTDLDAAIEQCELCKDSPFRMPSGHTVGENHAYMLEQLR